MSGIEVGRPVNWEPKTKAQKALLDSIGIVDFILFGGAAGSLKTETILVDAAQEYQNPNLHALIVRKTFKEIELDIEPKSYRLYPQMGATYNTSKRRWEWPWGAAIQFGYFESMKDCGRYFGPEFSLIDFDESTFHTEEVVRWLVTMRMRSRDPSLKLRVRLATNPGQIGAHWHKSIFMGPHCTHCRISEESKLPWKIYKDARWPSDNKSIMGSDDTPMSTMYIPGRLSDHNLLAGYKNRMKGLTDRMQNALLEGCWETTEGQYFDCWNYDLHVVNWETVGNAIGLRHTSQYYFSWFVSIDWGFGGSSAAAHLHVKYPDGMIYTVDEVLVKGMDAPDFANFLKMRWHGVIDPQSQSTREILAWYLSPDAWQSRGMRSDSGKSIAEQMCSASDIPFEAASTDRKAGWMSMYTLLKAGRWKICGDRCPELVKALPTRVHDPDNPGDIIKVISDPHDDIADGARYGLFSWIQTPKKPRQVLIQEFCTATDPTAYAMQRMMAEAKFKKPSKFVSYRHGKIGRA